MPRESRDWLLCNEAWRLLLHSSRINCKRFNQVANLQAPPVLYVGGQMRLSHLFEITPSGFLGDQKNG